MDYCEAALGALLPELDYGSQMWQSSSSFCDLDIVSMDVTTESGSVGCWDVLLEDAEPEFSSKQLSREFALGQPPTAIHTAFADCQPAAIARSPASALHQHCASQDCSPTASASLGSLPSYSAPLHDGATLASTATAHSSSTLCESAGSRAGSPEPHLPAEQPSQPDYGDAEAVRLAALALQMSQGDVNSAVAQLLTWSEAV